MNNFIDYFKYNFTHKFPNIFTNFNINNCNSDYTGGYDIINSSYVICCKIIDKIKFDYSEILQKLKSQIETTEKYFLKEVIYILIIKDITLIDIPISELKQIFKLSGINIFILNETQNNIIEEKVNVLKELEEQ